MLPRIRGRTIGQTDKNSITNRVALLFLASERRTFVNRRAPHSILLVRFDLLSWGSGRDPLVSFVAGIGRAKSDRSSKLSNVSVTGYHDRVPLVEPRSFRPIRFASQLNCAVPRRDRRIIMTSCCPARVDCDRSSTIHRSSADDEFGIGGIYLESQYLVERFFRLRTGRMEHHCNPGHLTLRSRYP